MFESIYVLRNVYQSKHGAVGLSSYNIATFKIIVENDIEISIHLRMSSHSGEVSRGFSLLVVLA